MNVKAPAPIVEPATGLLAAGPNHVRVLTGARTGAPIGAIEYHVAPGFSPPPVLHRHTREDAGWFVLEGELEFAFDGGRTERIAAGGAVTHPRTAGSAGPIHTSNRPGPSAGSHPRASSSSS